jgi:hypothetical protein
VGTFAVGTEGVHVSADSTILKYVCSVHTHMTNVTVTVNDDLKQEMSQFPAINWSQVAREAFEERVEEMRKLERMQDFEVMEDLAAESELTERDATDLAERIDRSIAEEFVGDARPE